MLQTAGIGARESHRPDSSCCAIPAACDSREIHAIYPTEKQRFNDRKHMYELIKALGVKQLLQHQAPVLGLSLILAEGLFKFHSFTLECLAFLATWFCADFLWQSARRLFRIRGLTGARASIE